ncbi:hypothetical protein C8J57DRAFT_1484606 [Mycena rebaudengoi]|nr:hypothetical protein C8J57DRAFT_1484606 [Mycena rebaudengoi]
MSVRMWLNIGVRRVDVLEHWGIDLHVKPSAPAARACALVQRLSRFTAGNVVPSIPSSFIPEDDGGAAVADAASGVPGDSAGSAGPVRALEDPKLSIEGAGRASWSERKVGWCTKWGSYRKQRWRGCTRVQAQDDKEPSTPSFRLDREVNDGRGRRKVSETTQIRGTIEKEDKTQMRLSSGSRAAERTLAQSDPSRNTVLNPALNPISIRGKCENLNKDGLGPGQTPVLK